MSAISVAMTVGLGQAVVTEQPVAVLGIGSCVAVFIFDPDMGLAAVAHVVLPHDDEHASLDTPARSAPAAVRWAVSELTRRGCDRRRLVAKLVGGAHLLAGVDLPDIGAANVAAVRAALRAEGIPVVAEDVGADYGRTAHADPATGRIVVLALGRGERVL